MTNKPITDPRRRAAIAMLRAGTATMSEVAALAGTSRQLVLVWAKLDKVDYAALRHARLQREWLRRFAMARAKTGQG